MPALEDSDLTVA